MPLNPQGWRRDHEKIFLCSPDLDSFHRKGRTARRLNPGQVIARFAHRFEKLEQVAGDVHSANRKGRLAVLDFEPGHRNGKIPRDVVDPGVQSKGDGEIKTILDRGQVIQTGLRRFQGDEVRMVFGSLGASL